MFCIEWEVFILAKKGAKLLGIQQDINPFSLMEDYLIIKQSEVTHFTISSHRSALRNFLAEYKGNIKDVKKLKQGVTLFLIDKNSSYYNKLLQALRQFFDYCIGEGVLKENPCIGLKFKHSNVRIVEHSVEVIKALIDSPDKSTFAGLRDYTFILTMLDNGIRPNELLQLQLLDIDFINKQMIIREEYSKTRQLRILPLSIQTVNAIKKLIQARHEAWGNDAPIFCSFSGYRLTSHNFQEGFRKYARKIGVAITPYHLRHTFALWFIRNGGNVFALQKIMGHSKLDMTQVYVNLVQADIKGQHEKATPLNNLFNHNRTVGKIKR